MNNETTENLVVLTLAKGSTAELRVLVEKCSDRDTARTIYTEIMQIAKKLRDRHNFGENKEKNKQV